MKGRIAWVMVPHLSGMATFSHLVSCGLRNRGWEVTWVGVGKNMALMADNGALGESWHSVLPHSQDTSECAAGLASWVREHGVSAIITVGDALAVTAIPLLPNGVRRILKCQSMTRHAYRQTSAQLGQTDLILVETPRQLHDLTRGWRVPEEKCALIPNGVEESVFIPPASRTFDPPLRLAYVGRLDDASKNVLLLPKIAARLVKAGLSFRLVIAGDGPERDRLLRSCHDSCPEGTVDYLGPITRNRLVTVLQENSILLLPSRFEGMPWSILEAMACGCVPIASRITQTTDTVVCHGESGFLCRVGDAGAFASAIKVLADDPDRLKTMSLAARKTIEDRFAVDRMIDAHDHVFTELLNQPLNRPIPVPSRRSRMPMGGSSTWKTYVPRPVKNLVRTWAERFSISV